MRRMTIIKKIAEVTASTSAAGYFTPNDSLEDATLIVEVLDTAGVKTTHFIPKFAYDDWYAAGGYDDSNPYQLKIDSSNGVVINSDSTGNFTVTIYKLG